MSLNSHHIDMSDYAHLYCNVRLGAESLIYFACESPVGKKYGINDICENEMPHVRLQPKPLNKPLATIQN